MGKSFTAAKQAWEIYSSSSNPEKVDEACEILLEFFSDSPSVTTNQRVSLNLLFQEICTYHCDLANAAQNKQISLFKRANKKIQELQDSFPDRVCEIMKTKTSKESLTKMAEAFADTVVEGRIDMVLWSIVKMTYMEAYQDGEILKPKEGEG